MPGKEENIDKTVLMKQDDDSSSGTAKPDESGLDKTIPMKQAGSASSGAAKPEAHIKQPKNLPSRRLGNKGLSGSFSVNPFRLIKQDVNSVLSQRKTDKVNVISNIGDMSSGKLKDISGNFSVGQCLATGGQGVISKGKDQTLSRTVAIKSLRNELCNDEEQRKSFLREACITAQLEHPAIVPVHGLYSKGENGLAVTMKMIQGCTLKEYMDQISSCYETAGSTWQYDEWKSLRHRLEIFLKICDALEYAHSRNIMHCDLKPENIMIGEYNEAYLMDWGIAEKITPDTGGIIPDKREKVQGTPRFLAPERLRGERGDARSDIFALGLILHEIVTFTEAFTGETTEEVVHNIANYNICPIEHRFGYTISKDLKAIISKASAYYADDRYSSVKALSEDIRKYLNNEEVAANPDSLFRKIIRYCFIRHGKATTITILGCLLLSVGISAYEIWQKLTLEKQERREQVQIGLQFAKSIQVASDFDREVVIWERDLINIAEKIYFLLDHEHTPEINEKRNDVLCSLENYNTPELAPASYKLHAKRGVMLDFDRIAYYLTPDIKPEEVNRRLNVAANMVWYFQNLLMTTPFGLRHNPHNRNKLFENMRTEKVPGFQVYYAFEDGSYFYYPGKTNSPDYDPRQRGWYRSRIGKNAPYSGWSVPYLDYHDKETVITYSARLEDHKGTPIGVLALDINLQVPLKNLLHDAENQPYILEKTFLNNHGGIIMTTNKSLDEEVDRLHRELKSGGVEFFTYPDLNLISEMRRKTKGYISREEDGKPIISVTAVFPVGKKLIVA